MQGEKGARAEDPAPPLWKPRRQGETSERDHGILFNKWLRLALLVPFPQYSFIKEERAQDRRWILV